MQLRVVSFKVDEDLEELIEEYARKLRIYKSELIRRALRRYIAELSNAHRPYITRRVRVY